MLTIGRPFKIHSEMEKSDQDLSKEDTLFTKKAIKLKKRETNKRF